MDYYQSKVLQGRESHLIGAGVSVIIMAPVFGLCGAILFQSDTGFYVVTALLVLSGLLAIVGGIKEKLERRRNFKS